MSKTWYPVIDYSLCTDCGACVKKCSHEVYNAVKAPASVVVKPEECVQGCHGCGNLCPNGAITYVGEDTGWTPPNAKVEESACSKEGCSCGGNC